LTILKRNFSTSAIIIKSRDFDETDRLVTVFSQHFGKLNLLAKGVRRVKSRQAGHLQTFNLVKIFGVKTKGIDLITQSETIEDYSYLSVDLKRTSQACYFFEVLDCLEPVEQENRMIFDLAKEFLRRLNKNALTRSEMFKFLFKLTQISGFGPPENIKTMPELDKYLESVIEKNLKSKRAFCA